MSTQIALRLPEDIVEFLDAQVSSGAAKSRADLVWRALRREQRRLAAERDAVIYAASEPDTEMGAITAATAHTPMPDLD